MLKSISLEELEMVGGGYSIEQLASRYQAGPSGWEEGNHYASFAYEGNGDLTAYHLRTGRVVMFAHDHAFDHIDVLDGCPPYTFYTIRECPDLHTWIETVAQQWIDCIETSPDV